MKNEILQYRDAVYDASRQGREIIRECDALADTRFIGAGSQNG